MPREIALVSIASVGILVACASAPRQHDEFPIAREYRVKAIAVLPGGGELAHAVGDELARRGFRVLPAAATARMVKDVDFQAVYDSYRPGRTAPATPVNLTDQLYAQSVDAVLIVKTEDFAPRPSRGYPYWQSAYCYLIVTSPERRWTQTASWANVDKNRPKTLAEAAVGIVNDLARRSSP